MKETLTDNSLIIECAAYTKELRNNCDFDGRFKSNIDFILEAPGEMSLEINKQLAKHIGRHTPMLFRNSNVRIEIPLITEDEIRRAEEIKCEINKTKSDIEALKDRLRVLEALDGKRDLYGTYRK